LLCLLLFSCSVLFSQHSPGDNWLRRASPKLPTRSICKMLGPFATASRRRPFTRCRYRYCRTPPAYRCPRRQRQRQRQRVTEGTAMVPWNGPNDVSNGTLDVNPISQSVNQATSSLSNHGHLIAVAVLQRRAVTAHKSSELSQYSSKTRIAVSPFSCLWTKFHGSSFLVASS